MNYKEDTATRAEVAHAVLTVFPRATIEQDAYGQWIIKTNVFDPEVVGEFANND